MATEDDTEGNGSNSGSSDGALLVAPLPRASH